MSPTAADLIGTWELERFLITFADGRKTVFPYGEDARGLLIYTAAGRVSAILSRADRATFGVPTLEKAGLASEEAKAEAFSSYLSYAGPYRVEDGRVVHEVELSLVPDTVGHEHVRRIELDGDRLVLSYEVTPHSGVVRYYALTWRRLSDRA